MSTLEVLLGAAQGKIKAADGREFALYPLRVPDIVRLQQRLGPARTWGDPSVHEKLADIETVCLVLWLSLRHDPKGKELTEEGVQDLFEASDLPKLGQASMHVLEISGFLKKAVEAESAAATGPGSGSTS